LKNYSRHLFGDSALTETNNESDDEEIEAQANDIEKLNTLLHLSFTNSLER